MVEEQKRKKKKSVVASVKKTGKAVLVRATRGKGRERPRPSQRKSQYRAEETWFLSDGEAM